MYACIPTTCFPHNFFLRVPRCRAPGAVGCIGLDLTSIYVQEKKENEKNLVILLLHMYTYDPTYTYPKCILLIVNSLRVPRCRAPGAGCNFRLDLAARLCTLHVVLLYWLWLEHGVYGLHLHAGLFFYVSFFSVRYTCFFSIAYGLSMACMPLTCMLVSFFLFLFSLA